MLKRSSFILIACAGIATQSFPADGEQGSSDPAALCKAMEQHDFFGVAEAPTKVVRAARVEGTQSAPAHCLVEGYVAPQVGFEVRLPQAGWNGKLIYIGCGGHCGSMWSHACTNPLQRGYACLVSDMGHKGLGVEGTWAYNNLQAEVDWGYRGTHVATLAGKAITARYYGKDAARSYFSGCSTGGRQALQEAQRFPWDFDGIIAGAPPIRLSDLYVTFAWGQHAAGTVAGKPRLTVADLRILTQGALAKCDMDDGLKDGIISRPLQCPFRASDVACTSGRKTECLDAEKVRAAAQIYSGPVDSAGRSLFGGGAVPGSEFGGAWNERFGANWERYYLEKNGRKSYLYGLTEEGLRLIFSSPDLGTDWSLKDFDFDRDYRRLDTMQSLYDSSNPDLSRFKDAGGKLMIYIGLNDISIPHTIIDYYQKVERVMGGRQATQDFARLFALPAVEHCMGGPGADKIDYLTYLEDWVERGKAPDRLMAYHLKPGDDAGTFPPALVFPPPPATVEFSRPVYPYPAFAKYKGRGDPNDAASFGSAIVADEPHNR